MTSNRRAWRARLTAFRLGAGLVTVLFAAVSAPHAQQGPAAGGTDPRVGLKPGFRDAGQVASYLELVASLPRPNGFFDPAAPGGAPAPTEPDRPADGDRPAASAANAAGGQAPAPQTPPRTDLNFANSDLAFSGDRMFVGNFNGFNVYAIE